MKIGVNPAIDLTMPVLGYNGKQINQVGEEIIHQAEQNMLDKVTIADRYHSKPVTYKVKNYTDIKDGAQKQVILYNRGLASKTLIRVTQEGEKTELITAYQSIKVGKSGVEKEKDFIKLTGNGTNVAVNIGGIEREDSEWMSNYGLKIKSNIHR